jgi:hypothetical protein
MFTHLLITRFNLRRDDWKVSKKNETLLTDEWHKNRFDLFNNFCFSSVLSQTNKNFKWLVFFDITTPDYYKDMVSEMESQMDNFIPFFIDGMAQFLPSITSYIANYKQDYLITSRLDNDDCLSKFYIEEIQKRFDKQDFMALDFVDGYTLQTQPTIKLGKRLDQFNPFISLIEKNKSPKTVWSVRHSHWKREKNVLQIRGSRVWTSVIHQENKVNEFIGYGNVNVDHFFENFKISETQKLAILTNLIPYSKWQIQSFLNIWNSYWNLKFKQIKKTLGVYKYK